MDEEIFSLADKVIETLKRKKIIEFGELAGEVDGDKKNVRKVVDLLERQGMVNVEYKLTKVIVAWNDAGPVSTLPIAYGKYKIISMDQKEMSKEAEKEKVELRKEIFSQSAKNELPFITKEVEFEEKPELKGERAGEKKKLEKTAKAAGLPPLPSLTALEQARRRETERQKQMQKEMERATKEKQKLKEKELKKHAKLAKELLREQQSKGKSEKEKERPRTSGIGTYAEGKTILSEYLSPKQIEVDETSVALNEEDGEVDETKRMAEELRHKLQGIQEKKAEMSELNRKKLAIVEEYYAPLTQRVEAELAVITDLVSDKETKIKKLKDRLKALPERISDIDIDALELRNTELEAKRRFSEAISALEDVVKEIKDVQKSTRTEVGAAKETLGNQVERLNALKGQIGNYAEAEFDLEKRLAAAKNRIEKEMAAIDSIEEELGTIRSVSEGTKGKVSEIEIKIEEGKESLNAVDAEIKNLSKLDDLIMGVKEKYSGALRGLENEIAAEEADMARLREVVESGFARKYLSELESMHERHEAEVTTIAMREQDINEQLDKAKLELRRLIRQSRELSDRLHSSLPKKQASLGDIDKEIEKRMDMAEEKGIERQKEVEERRSVLSELSEFLAGLKKR
jgi:methyl-accepting chemotaxis protein